MLVHRLPLTFFRAAFPRRIPRSYLASNRAYTTPQTLVSIMAAPVTDQIAKLEAARHLVLSDSTHYAAIVPGILPIIGAQSHLEIRRWGADFLAEAFASPALSLQGKESLSVQVLQTLKELLELPDEDTGVLKSVIQAAASIYGLIFRYMYVEPLHSSCRASVPAIGS